MENILLLHIFAAWAQRIHMVQLKLGTESVVVWPSDLDISTRRLAA